jgi:hypothetical protein
MHAKIERQIDLELRSISRKFSRRAKGKETERKKSNWNCTVLVNWSSIKREIGSARTLRNRDENWPQKNARTQSMRQELLVPPLLQFPPLPP